MQAEIERICAASADHFFLRLDDVNWGHVTVLVDHAELLRRNTDALYHDGEHAR